MEQFKEALVQGDERVREATCRVMSDVATGIDPADALRGLCDELVGYSRRRPGPVSQQLLDADDAMTDLMLSDFD